MAGREIKISPHFVRRNDGYWVFSLVTCAKGMIMHIHVLYDVTGVAANDRVILHEREHAEYRWLSRKDLFKREFRLTRSIRFYCSEALKHCGDA